MKNEVATEPAEKHFADEYTKWGGKGEALCMVIPEGIVASSISEIIAIAGGRATIIDPDECGDDTFIVRIGNKPQEALSADDLMIRLGIHSLL